MTKGRMTCLIVFSILGLVFLLWLGQVIKAFSDARKAGLLSDEKVEKYQVGRENNLKAIHKALLQAADSDGQFPKAEKWMESALIRLKTSDLSESEAQKKLAVPGLTEGFGYAFNDVFSGKRPEDFKGKEKSVFIYESKQTAWDAHGDPAKDARPGGKGVAFDGTVVNLGK